MRCPSLSKTVSCSNSKRDPMLLLYSDQATSTKVDKEELRHEIAQSVNSYAWFADPDNVSFDEVIPVRKFKNAENFADLEADWPELVDGRIYRVEDWDHVPKREKQKHGPHMSYRHVFVNCQPFKHFTYTGGELVETARSNWEGSLHNGQFSISHGTITPRLQELWCKMIAGIASKPNYLHYTWNVDLRVEAYMHLLKKGLMYNLGSDTSPFAWYTSVIEHNFYQSLNREKTRLKAERELAREAGGDLTYTEEIQWEWERQLRERGQKEIGTHIVPLDTDEKLFKQARKHLVKYGDKKKKYLAYEILEAMKDL